MITKRGLIAVPMLLAFTAISGSAYASSQPSDKAWWPNQSRPKSEQSNVTRPGVQQTLPRARSKSKAAKPESNVHQFLGPRGYH